jgi:aminobenzoyl-glutamate utilization protein B
MSEDITVLNYLETQEGQLIDVARALWEHPEVALHETFASSLLADQLEKAGFSVQRDIRQLPTAFVASWGSGDPVIGILAEYDALPGLSQKVSSLKEPVIEGGPGHGCGHNLFAAGSLGAALAVKEAMQKHHLPGTLRLYGCPAEETLTGKVYMAREGVFNDLTAALEWHPGYTNSAGGSVTLSAMNSFKVNFHGLAAHAGSAPHLGRSALDGVMLMDMGVNYLREHVEPEVRMHCVVTRGGDAPNIVPASAQVWYFVRAPRRGQVEQVYARVLDIAKGAALMSGTTYDIDFITGCHETLPNKTLGKLIQANMERLGGPKFTSQDVTFASQLQNSIPQESLEMSTQLELHIAAEGITRADLGNPLCAQFIHPKETYSTVGGSTDVAEVSQIVPTGGLSTCCQPLGMPGHSWQIVAASGSGIGHAGMMLAAKTLALTALDLLNNADIVTAAREEHAIATQGKPYTSPLPDDAYPH